MVPNRRRKPIALEPGQDPASLPLKHPPRELFAQAVARGVNVDQAYREAGYAGNSASRRELRCSADVDARIRWLLAERIESDARVRAPGIKEEQDARLRLIRELEAIAYVDPGDLMQWDRDPVFDEHGNLIGYKDRLELTPSKHLTKAQRSAVKAVSRTVKRDWSHRPNRYQWEAGSSVPAGEDPRNDATGRGVLGLDHDQQHSGQRGRRRTGDRARRGAPARFRHRKGRARCAAPGG